MKAPQAHHERVEVALAQRVALDTRTTSISRIRHLDQALEHGDFVAFMVSMACVGEAAEQEVQLLAAAMRCAVKRAAAAHVQDRST